MKAINIVTLDGKVASTVKTTFKLPETPHTQAIFDSVNIENQNKRQATAHTKTKAEVSGTGKKPYRQKHTGRARQGSRRNPQFVGGGLAFGPRNNRNYKIKINKKTAILAEKSAWLDILNSGNISILDKDFAGLFKTPKTKTFFEFLKKINIETKKILFVVTSEEDVLFLSSNNIPNIIVKRFHNLSVRDLLNQNYLLLTDMSWKNINSKLL